MRLTRLTRSASLIAVLQGNALGPAGAAGRASVPTASSLGTYQVGVVVPVTGGCG